MLRVARHRIVGPREEGSKHLALPFGEVRGKDLLKRVSAIAYPLLVEVSPTSNSSRVMRRALSSVFFAREA
jgi:hypothetical protein